MEYFINFILFGTIGLVSLFIVIFLTISVKNSPLIEMKILAVAISMLTLQLILNEVILHLYIRQILLPQLGNYMKLLYVLRYLAIICLLLIILLPSLSLRYNDVFLVTLVVTIPTTTMMVLIETLTVTAGTTFSVRFDPISTPFRATTLILAVSILYYRFKQINRIQTSSRVVYTHSTRDFTILTIIGILILVFATMNSDPNLSIGLADLVTSLGLCYLSYIVFTNHYFLFITDLEIMSVALVSKDTNSVELSWGSHQTISQMEVFVEKEFLTVQQLFKNIIDKMGKLESIQIGLMKITIIDLDNFFIVTISKNQNLIGKQLLDWVARELTDLPFGDRQSYQLHLQSLLQVISLYTPKSKGLLVKFRDV